jgi:pimeloyl-ACP methyl ester carboxylesterase
MTEVIDLFSDLKKEFKNIPLESRFNHIRQRLSAITNDEKRKDLEDVFLFMQSSGMLNTSTKPVVVAMIHGIRTQGEWHDNLKELIESKSNAIVKPIKFGFFDAVSFWLPIFTIFRWLKVRHVTKEMRILRRDYPDHEVVIVAHSFGTFLTAKFLEKNIDFNIDRLLLCGSIVPASFDWNKLPNYPTNGNAINDIGTKDLWPIFAKTSTFGYGDSGSFGFDTHTIEDRYHETGHSGFFTDELFNSYWLPFILDGEIVKSPSTTNRKPKKYYLSLLSLFPGISLVSLVSFTLYYFF